MTGLEAYMMNNFGIKPVYNGKLQVVVLNLTVREAQDRYEQEYRNNSVVAEDENYKVVMTYGENKSYALILVKTVKKFVEVQAEGFFANNMSKDFFIGYVPSTETVELEITSEETTEDDTVVVVDTLTNRICEAVQTAVELNERNFTPTKYTGKVEFKSEHKIVYTYDKNTKVSDIMLHNLRNSPKILEYELSEKYDCRILMRDLLGIPLGMIAETNKGRILPDETSVNKISNMLKDLHLQPVKSTMQSTTSNLCIGLNKFSITDNIFYNSTAQTIITKHRAEQARVKKYSDFEGIMVYISKQKCMDDYVTVSYYRNNDMITRVCAVCKLIE